MGEGVEMMRARGLGRADGVFSCRERDRVLRDAVQSRVLVLCCAVGERGFTGKSVGTINRAQHFGQ